ncbi:hypothetical protein BZA70DRAFT_278318 [Myxozyma melibiosi]|uniref:Peptidyl-prolyl cis-trans isomerase n=1 Tax=Myxozyma melibiosi TaxID=54550 RepID=A0ABR1F6P9_9ASCO
MSSPERSTHSRRDDERSGSREHRHHHHHRHHHSSSGSGSHRSGDSRSQQHHRHHHSSSSARRSDDREHRRHRVDSRDRVEKPRSSQDRRVGERDRDARRYRDDRSYGSSSRNEQSDRAWPSSSGSKLPPEIQDLERNIIVEDDDDEDAANKDEGDEDETEEERKERERRERDARSQALTLEILGDLPYAEVKPPENVLFICKLNPITEDEDLQTFFSQCGKILSCEIIKDPKTGKSLQYGFIEYENSKDCENAYVRMQGALIDDSRIHVDFSQSVSKLSTMWRKRTNSKRLQEAKESATPKATKKKWRD